MAYYMKKATDNDLYGTDGGPEKAPKRGEIYWIKRNTNRQPIGSVIWQDRPAVVVSNDGINAGRGTVEVVYLTTSPKKDAPEHCTIRSTGTPSTVLCEQISTIDKSQLSKYVGTVTDQERQIIDACLAMSLGLEEARVIRKIDATDDLTITEGQAQHIKDMEVQLEAANRKLATLRKLCTELINQ